MKFLETVEVEDYTLEMCLKDLSTKELLRLKNDKFAWDFDSYGSGKDYEKHYFREIESHVLKGGNRKKFTVSYYEIKKELSLREHVYNSKQNKKHRQRMAKRNKGNGKSKNR